MRVLLAGAAAGDLDRGAGVAPGRRVREFAAIQLDHEGTPAKVLVLPPRRGPGKVLTPAALGRPIGEGRVALLHPGSPVTGKQNLPPGLVVPDGHVRPDVLDEPLYCAALGLRERVRPRVVAARLRNASLPSVGEVAVEIDAARVLAGVGGDAIGVDRLDDPELHARGVAVAVLEDANDLVTLGLVAVDRANDEPGALRIRIADAGGDELRPVHGVT